MPRTRLRRMGGTIGEPDLCGLPGRNGSGRTGGAGVSDQADQGAKGNPASKPASLRFRGTGTEPARACSISARMCHHGGT